MLVQPDDIQRQAGPLELLLQLLQPFLTLLASAWWVGESADAMTWLVAVLVVALVAIGKSSQVAGVPSRQVQGSRHREHGKC